MMDYHKIKTVVHSIEMTKAMENRLKINLQEGKRKKIIPPPFYKMAYCRCIWNCFVTTFQFATY